jgi:hypothetical protein
MLAMLIAPTSLWSTNEMLVAGFSLCEGRGNWGKGERPRVPRLGKDWQGQLVKMGENGLELAKIGK